MLSFVLFPTHLGWMGLVGSQDGVKKVFLPQADRDSILHQIDAEYNLKKSDTTSNSFEDLIQRLQQYLDGKRTEFQDKLDLNGATTFQQAVWKTTRTIPYGETRSYSWIANRAGSAGARATGQALKRNPFPIIVPCHRVIRNDSTLGGFSGGIELKKYLLKMESSFSG
jgi:methylated-DNA-[protein]-cysteine S-methyltransferase